MPALAADFDQIGDLIATIGSAQFASSFFRLARYVMDVQECTVFSFHNDTPPEPVLIEGACGQNVQTARRLAADYISGGYLHDPNVKRLNSDLAVYAAEPSSIDNALYRAHFYEHPALAHELVVLGRAENTLYYTSFYRRNPTSNFDSNDIESMASVAKLLVKTLHRHRTLTPPEPLAAERPLSSDEVSRNLREALLDTPFKLSPREAEVCAGIILGHTPQRIATDCAIALNTVATHRKRAYAKLGISSQNELFGRYFGIVREIQGRTRH